ncbi:uncharacterized protein LOC124386268 [Silurus meridionalis]|uniref:Ig-like domain-containing protein n=1 Tax=Silurus meridionalis TaxID=175797 RepID=A0A8T0BN29_SILME|nr:uncharacterized protein LOC124386268 [Silurus meridionalis]KAF7706977.1 hypothetical protein HF521_018195 [Silurus meridionalis]
MASHWILFLIGTIIFPAHAVDFTRPSFVSVKSGERVTLNCTFQDANTKELCVWYKQEFGELPQEVGKMIANRDIQTSPEFDSVRFKVEKILSGISLTIVQIKKSDEGLYFCGVHAWGKFQFSNGTFIDVADVKVTVLQSSVSDSVPAGASVTLQCSVLSESRAAELQVLWFRAAPSQSHPQLIYTHHNSSLQCESESSTHTCVYNLSKNIFSLNDTGTYYCAVALCGKIIFGNGTRVQLEQSGSLVICFAVALAVCVVVIIAQAILRGKKLNLKQNRVKLPQGSLTERTPNQDCGDVELNYAALNFTERKTKRGRANRGQDTVYSEARFTHVT